MQRNMFQDKTQEQMKRRIGTLPEKEFRVMMVLQAQREWHNTFKVMKGKNLRPRILYSARFLFRFSEEIKSFMDKQKLREFSTKQALQ